MHDKCEAVLNIESCQPFQPCLISSLTLTLHMVSCDPGSAPNCHHTQLVKQCHPSLKPSHVKINVTIQFYGQGELKLDRKL